MHPEIPALSTKPPATFRVAASGFLLLQLAAGLAAAQSLEKLPQNIRDVTPANMSRLPELDDGYVERIAPKITVRPKPPTRPDIWPKPEVIAAGHLRSGETEIRIAGISALDAGAACGNGEEAWPCGIFARAAFQRLIRRRPITCDPTTLSDHRITSRCRVGGLDLGTWLVQQGWAIPSGEGASDASYSDALAAARRARAGQWRDDPPAIAGY